MTISTDVTALPFPTCVACGQHIDASTLACERWDCDGYAFDSAERFRANVDATARGFGASRQRLGADWGVDVWLLGESQGCVFGVADNEDGTFCAFYRNLAEHEAGEEADHDIYGGYSLPIVDAFVLCHRILGNWQRGEASRAAWLAARPTLWTAANLPAPKANDVQPRCDAPSLRCDCYGCTAEHTGPLSKRFARLDFNENPRATVSKRFAMLDL